MSASSPAARRKSWHATSATNKTWSCAYFLRTARYADLSAADFFSHGRRAGWHHVTIRPLYTFFYRYFIRLGFLDGTHGFVISVMGAIGAFLKYMKLYELQKNLNRIRD
jgi:hypothetical protein